MTRARWTTLGLLSATLIAGAVLLLQAQEVGMLGRERDLLRQDQQVLARLRAENERLKAQQPAPDMIHRLRADRAAIGQLRTEIEGIKRKLEPR